MSKKKLLLLDDEHSVARALCLLLEALGYEVTQFNLPDDALNYLKELRGTHNPDEPFPFLGMLCDLRMPQMDGLNVLKLTRGMFPKLPFVLMSGHATSIEIEIAKKLGATGFLLKPFSVDQLKGILATITPPPVPVLQLVVPVDTAEGEIRPEATQSVEGSEMTMSGVEEADHVESGKVGSLASNTAVLDSAKPSDEAKSSCSPGMATGELDSELGIPSENQAARAESNTTAALSDTAHSPVTTQETPPSTSETAR